MAPKSRARPPAVCSLLQCVRIQVAFSFGVDAAFRRTTVGRKGLGRRSVRAYLHEACVRGGDTESSREVARAVFDATLYRGVLGVPSPCPKTV